MTTEVPSGFAPVAVFAFKRPGHLIETLESLGVNAEAALSDITIFCDGPRSEADLDDVRAVRRVAYSTSGFRSVRVVERERNLGLAASVIEGVGQILHESERVIVVEDDLHLSPYFLAYMNDALELYADDDRIGTIHGYCYPIKDIPFETFFLKGADCWGWATWRRAWAYFREDGTSLLAEMRVKGLTTDFDLGGGANFTQMLEDQVAGRNNSWAVRWHASSFLAGLLTLYPGRSLVHNIGNDASGTHSRATQSFNTVVSDHPIRVGSAAVEESLVMRQAFSKFLQPRGFRKIARRLREFYVSRGHRR